MQADGVSTHKIGRLVGLGNKGSAITSGATADVEPGYGLHYFSSDYDHGSANNPDDYLAVYDKANTKVRFYYRDKDGSSPSFLSDEVTFGGAIKPNYYYGDGLLRMEGVLNQPINDRLALRASFQSARSNGFRENVFLDAEDSNKRLEESLRLKMRYVAPSGLLLKGALFRVDADNGYDMWAPDNNEELFTYTNQPGDDHQTTTAASIRAEKLFTNLSLIHI